MQLIYTLVLNDSKDTLVVSEDGSIKREGEPNSRMICHLFNIEGTEQDIRRKLTRTIDQLFEAAAIKRKEQKNEH